MAWITKRASGKYTVGWREADGHKRYRTFSRSEDARRFKTEIQSQIDRGEYTPVEARKVPLGEYTDLVLGAGDLADSTRSNYEYRRAHLRDLEKYAIGDISTNDIRRVLARMEAAGIGAPARAHVRKLLAKVFNQAIREGILARNPVAAIPAPRAERREIHVYSREEIWALERAMPEHLKGAVLVSAFGGLRGGEIAGLAVENVDWLRGTVKITQAVRLVRGKAVLGQPKTASSRRLVTLPRFVLDVLVPRNDPFLWGTVRGELTSSKVLGGEFRKALGVTGLSGRWHDLRHTSVALAIQQGAHPKEIQARLGHGSIVQTLDTYGHLFPGMDQELADRMEAAYAYVPETRVVGLPMRSGE